MRVVAWSDLAPATINGSAQLSESVRFFAEQKTYASEGSGDAATEAGKKIGCRLGPVI